jgi:hypothetical protein
MDRVKQIAVPVLLLLVSFALANALYVYLDAARGGEKDYMKHLLDGGVPDGEDG